MNDEEAAERARQYAENYPRYRPKDVPTIFADGVIGIANSNGVTRLTFVKEVYDTAPGAKVTAIEPAFVLVIPYNQLINIANEILQAHTHMLAQQEAAGATKQ